MSARTAVETIQAAIEKLEGLKSGYVEINGWLAETADGASGAIDDPGYKPLTDDPLIVTLHRTIDAQLAILRESARLGTTFPGSFPSGNYDNEVTALALAILGESS